MPTYQYACTECDHAFEQFQSFNEESLTTCPECEGRLRKVFNAVGVVFKGSGFYRTDNRPDSKPAASSSTTKAESSAKSSDTSASTASTASAPSAGSSTSTSTDAA